MKATAHRQGRLCHHFGSDSRGELLSTKRLSREQAIETLELCATLIRDECLPYNVDRKRQIKLLHLVTNVKLSKLTRNTRVEIRQGAEAKEVPILRGIHLHLTRSGRLLAVSFLPSKMKERTELLKLVGIARDEASDVAARHDHYLEHGVSPHSG